MSHYITGGERSGKSSLAQSLAEQISDQSYYLATSTLK
ncbi:bifunctional adenosylcobinamide kinase/adenosylcobinamide-phosphate guanylyltransferase [Psychrobacter sp. UBA3962]|nr:bifunctional adenosylcobinamide kinase/adenosylcobinamide-phosphate guanylyltransferase [Psychrobacter sp. UBA3962]